MTDETPIIYPIAGKRIWVAGHTGMVGSAVVRRLAREDCEVLTISRNDLDLRRHPDVENWLSKSRPDAIVLAAATVGGIIANDRRPADFLYDNLAIECAIIESARAAGTEKLLFLGSACIYPKLAPQPIDEDALLAGPLEPTNQWYAVAKIAGIKLCQAYRRQHGCDFISAMPNNLYGPLDNFDPVESHVVAALMRKIHEAQQAGRDKVEIWGTGTPRREFLYVDDLADALVFLLQRYSDEQHLNIGIGQDVTITELAEILADVIGYKGSFEYDRSKPDGTPHKLLDSTRLSEMGWTASTSLEDGLQLTYDWYCRNAT